MFSIDGINHTRTSTYAGVAAILLACAYPVSHAAAEGSRELHTLLETISTVLTLIAGAMSLVRYYTQKTGAFLLFGVAFLGASTLDGCHMILTSSFTAGWATTSFPQLTVWSGVSSRAFLATLLVFSCYWTYRDRVPPRNQEIAVYLWVSLGSVGGTIALSFAPLISAYQPDLLFHRPAELVPAGLFGLAVIAYLRRGTWRLDSFEHFLILSMLMAALGHLSFMSLSSTPFDAPYMAAHVIKVLSYVLVLTGLFQSMITIFRRETEAQISLRRARDELDDRVRERTHALASANQALRIQIDQRKRIEAELFFLAAIVESSDEAIFSKSLDGKILTWNHAAERTYGYGREELIGRTADFLVPPERREQERECLKKVAAGESVRHEETVHLKKDATAMEIRMTVFPLRSNGEITALAGIVSDVTQRKVLERQLAQAQKLESIGQLAAGVAHEINTPIQYVDYNLRFLLESFLSLDNALRNEVQTGQMKEGDLDYLRSEIPRSIQQSIEGVEHVAQIVRAMREYAHPGAIEKAPADINRSIESAIQVSRNTWKYAAEMVASLDPDLPMVECISGEIGQVILNLIVNAAQALEEVVQRQPGYRGIIEITTRREDSSVEIRVRDTGDGIPEEIQSSVFNPFFTTKPVGKGTGQGLAIAHSVVVQKHGGSISFETQAGVGTTFTVRLPVSAHSRK